MIVIGDKSLFSSILGGMYGILRLSIVKMKSQRLLINPYSVFCFSYNIFIKGDIEVSPKEKSPSTPNDEDSDDNELDEDEEKSSHIGLVKMKNKKYLKFTNILAKLTSKK
jgi:hypothetical protein